LVEFTNEAIWSWLVCWEFFFITDSVSLLVINLFCSLFLPDSALDSYVSRNSCISSRLSNLLAYNSSFYSLIILCISVVLSVNYFFSFTSLLSPLTDFLYIYLILLLFCFLLFLFLWSFFSTNGVLFIISGKAGLVVMNSFNFLLSQKLFISFYPEW